MSLNPDALWDLNIDIGAASADLDLSKYKISKVDIEMGAASLKLKLGENVDESRVKISGGASSLHIIIPQNAGCEIETDVALSSKHFRGFNRLSGDHYITDNFSNASKKIYLDIKTGVSSITIDRSNDW